MPNEKFKETVITTKLRRQLDTSVEDAVRLESESHKAIAAARRLQPTWGA
jgi:hypothetical protein